MPDFSIFSFAKKRCLLWQRFFLQGSLYRGAGSRRRSERLFLNISRKTAGFVEYIIYTLFVAEFYFIWRGDRYEGKDYLSDGRSGFGLRAGLGL